MLQKSIFLCSCILIYSTGVMAATGSMRCKVKSNDLIIMENGTSKKYRGYTDGIKDGDNLILRYQANDNGVSLALENLSNPNAVPRIGVTISKSEIGFESFDVKANEYNSEGGIVRRLNTNIAAYNDSLDFRGPIYHGKFERYYKSDWHGVVYSVLGLEAHLIGIACTNNNDGLDKFIKAIKAY